MLEDPRLQLFHGSFADLQNVAAEMGKTGEYPACCLIWVFPPRSWIRRSADLVLCAMGHWICAWIPAEAVCSRMDCHGDEQDIARVIKEYGEERFARRMASAVVKERVKAPITGTVQLAGILAAAHPAWERGKHPATKAFQAIRIFINRELEDLEDLLAQVIDNLKVGGRLVIISFHSLEDRRVKRFIRDQEQGIKLPKNLPIRDVDRGVRLVKVGKAIKPAVTEVDGNIRSRSAVMRIAERVA